MQACTEDDEDDDDVNKKRKSHHLKERPVLDVNTCVFGKIFNVRLAGKGMEHVCTSRNGRRSNRTEHSNG